jgi:hypothetical protein
MWLLFWIGLTVAVVLMWLGPGLWRKYRGDPAGTESAEVRRAADRESGPWMGMGGT